jgi:hypothetical protein
VERIGFVARSRDMRFAYSPLIEAIRSQPKELKSVAFDDRSLKFLLCYNIGHMLMLWHAIGARSRPACAIRETALLPVNRLPFVHSADISATMGLAMSIRMLGQVSPPRSAWRWVREGYKSEQ